MSPLLRDVGYASYCIILILTSFLLHYLIWTFIWQKPEGRKTVIAVIYLNTSFAMLSCSTSATLPVLVRLILGPMPSE